MVINLDINSNIPLYQQLTEILRTAIRDGTYAINTKIPTESELGEKYGISRITVRNAIDELASEGLVIKRQGKGTYVAPNQVIKKMGSAQNFTKVCEEAGKIPSSRVVRLTVTPGMVIHTRFLNIPDHSNIIHIQRVRLADGSPVILETSIFPPNWDFLLREPLENSIYTVLEKHGIRPAHYRKAIDIEYAKENEQEFLHVPQNKPLLQVSDYVYDQNHKPVHFTKQLIISDLFQYQLEG